MRKTNSLKLAIKNPQISHRHKKTLSETQIRSPKVKPKLKPSSTKNSTKRHIRANSDQTPKNFDTCHTMESDHSKQTLREFFRKRLKQKSAKTSFPMTPAQALKAFRNHLSTFQQSEILYYKQIYYVGDGKRQGSFQDE